MAPDTGTGNLRRVFLTGATGFLGMALAERLLAEGVAVRGMARAGSAPASVEWLERHGVELVRGDLEHEPPLPGGLAPALDGCELVIHCAAVIGYRRRLGGRMWRTNVLGTRRVVEAALAAGTPRLVHVSSIAAVGLSDEPELLTEDAPWNCGVLQAPYFDTKRAAEAEVEAGLAAGLDAVTVNPAAIYGPSLAASNSSKVLVQILRGRMRFVPPGGVNVVPLDTVVDGCLAAARRGATGRRYILGGENLTLAQLVERVGRAGGKTLRARELPVALGPPARFLMDVLEPFVPDRVWFTPDMASVFGRYLWFDSGRAERELGVVPSSLDACLEATVRQLGVA